MKMESVECICTFHGGLTIKRILVFQEDTTLNFGEVWVCLRMVPVWVYNISMAVFNVKAKIKKLEAMVLALRRMSISIMEPWSGWLVVVKVFHSMTTIVRLIVMLLINSVFQYCDLITIGQTKRSNKLSICKIPSKNFTTTWELSL